MISILKEKGETVLLAAPTGRAAKRDGRTDREGGKDHPPVTAGGMGCRRQARVRKNERNLLACDALVIDELSMVDVPLFESLLRAVPAWLPADSCRGQRPAPSVGPGNVAGDLLATGLLPTVRLQEVFLAGDGKPDCDECIGLSTGNAGAGTERWRFLFLPVRMPDKIMQTIFGTLREAAASTLRVFPVWDIQVLAPGRKGELGTQELNRRLQAVLNPESADKKEIKTGSSLFVWG